MNYAMLHHGAVVPHRELRDHDGHEPVDAHLGLHHVQAVPLHRGNCLHLLLPRYPRGWEAGRTRTLNRGHETPSINNL